MQPGLDCQSGNANWSPPSIMFTHVLLRYRSENVVFMYSVLTSPPSLSSRYQLLRISHTSVFDNCHDEACNLQ
jgi:hypothetical protein